MSVLVQNHGNNIRSPGSRPCFENHTDTDTINNTPENSRQQLLIQHRSVCNSRLQQSIITVNVVDQAHERRNSKRTDNGFHTKHSSQEIDAQQQQRHIHTKGRNFSLPPPQMMKYHRQTICSPRSKTVRLGK